MASAIDCLSSNHICLKSWIGAVITSIRMGNIKSFFAPQSITMSRANGSQGSGYNVIVGENNTGKSTILTMARYLLSGSESMTIGREARHDTNKPVLEVVWEDAEGSDRISIDTDTDGAIFRKIGNRSRINGNFRFVPSRRPFGSDFAPHILDFKNYESTEFDNRIANQAHFDNQLATSIASLFRDTQKKAEFLRVLSAVDPNSASFSSDNVGGRNVLLYTGPSKRQHVITDTGDGITNLIRIVYSLVTSEPLSCIVVDEPELSLHPQLQRNLYKVLLSYSNDRQVVVLTHSPHFVDWQQISGTARLFRVLIDDEGSSRIVSPSNDSFSSVNAYSDVMSRKYYDSVCKELFFARTAVLLEGAEDVHYIENFLEATGQAPLPIMGYGCGGASVIRPWMRLCCDLNIKCAALFDGDKKSEFDNSQAEFSNRADRARSFLLFKDDIRDKHERNSAGRETSKIIKQGVFRRDGVIHKTSGTTFKLSLSRSATI